MGNDNKDFVYAARKGRPFPANGKRMKRNAFGYLLNLPFYREFYNRVTAGIPPSKIAEWIQGKGFCTDIKKTSLQRHIYIFRNRLPKGEFLKEEHRGIYMKAKKELDKKMSEVEEMAEIYKLQRERVNVDVETEKKIGKLFSTTHKEIELCMNILRASAEMKMDLGLEERQLGKFGVESKYILEAQALNDEEAQEVFNDPKSRRRVLNVARKLLMLKSNNFDEEDDGDEMENVIDMEEARGTFESKKKK